VRESEAFRRSGRAAPRARLASAALPSSSASTGPPTFGVTSLTKRFGARTALRGVEFMLKPGELVAIIGPNGAGKTTLLSIMAGVLAPTEGSAGGLGNVGWVPQQPALYAKLSVAENLRLFARLEKLTDPGAAVERMLDQADLRDRADDEVGRLSGGNRQRVNIAIGLLAEPAVLLLDEPSSSLDPRQRERLWEFIGRLAARGTTVLYSTHNVAEAERYADRVLVLADGELLFTGTPSELESAVQEQAPVPAAGRPADFESAFVAFLAERGH
jgi:ABC-2 type transport system ATP-binding protein